MSGPDFPDGCTSGPDDPCFKSVRYTNHSTQVNVLSSSEPILNGRGFEVFVGTDLTIFGGTTLNNTGNLNNTAGITKSFSTGWTTIGNPCACPIAFNTISKSSSIGKYFYVYDSNSGAYQWYGQTSGTSSIPEITADGLIAKGQAVWIFASSIGTMTYEQANKSTADALFIRGHIPASKAIEIKLSEENTAFFTSIQLEENTTATAAYDETLDILDFKTGHEKAPLIGLITNSTILRKNYYESLKNTHHFWIDYSVAHEGNYTVELSNLPVEFNKQSILLIDHYALDTINLATMSYTFNVNNASQSSDRFELLILPKTELNTGENDLQLTVSRLEIQQMNHSLILTNSDSREVVTQVTLTNLLGETMYQLENVTLNPGRNELILPTHIRGMYIVQLKTEHYQKMLK